MKLQEEKKIQIQKDSKYKKENYKINKREEDFSKKSMKSNQEKMKSESIIKKKNLT